MEVEKTTSSYFHFSHVSFEGRCRLDRRGRLLLHDETGHSKLQAIHSAKLDYQSVYRMRHITMMQRDSGGGIAAAFLGMVPFLCDCRPCPLRRWFHILPLHHAFDPVAAAGARVTNYALVN